MATAPLRRPVGIAQRCARDAEAVVAGVGIDRTEDARGERRGDLVGEVRTTRGIERAGRNGDVERFGREKGADHPAADGRQGLEGLRNRAATEPDALEGIQVRHVGDQALHPSRPADGLGDAGPVEIALLDAASAPGDRSEAFFSRADDLRELFKFEFYLPRRVDYRAEIERRVSDRFEDWEEILRGGEAGVREAFNKVQLLVAHGVLRSFVDAYRVAARVLATAEADAVDSNSDFLSRCLKTGKQELLQGRVFSAESISKSLYQTGLQLARYRGLLAARGIAPARFEAWMIRRALDACDGHQSDAARRLGLSRTGLFKKMRKLGL